MLSKHFLPSAKSGVGWLGVMVAAVIGMNAAAATPAHAQVIGFKLGPTFSSLEMNDNGSSENRLTSLGGGGFIRFALGGLSIQPEIMALTKGSDVDGPGDNDIQLQLDYIEVPVLARYAFGNGRFMPYVMAGPSFNFGIGCEVETEFNNEENSSDCEDALFDRKDTDIGLTGALGLELGVGPGAMLFEGRYVHGLTDVSRNDGGVDVKNRTFAIFAGYSIPLGPR
jgi:hypothetical protein